jgi:hypothetical protein
MCYTWYPVLLRLRLRTSERSTPSVHASNMNIDFKPLAYAAKVSDHNLQIMQIQLSATVPTKTRL